MSQAIPGLVLPCRSRTYLPFQFLPYDSLRYPETRYGRRSIRPTLQLLQAQTARSSVGRSSRRRVSVATPSMMSANSARFSRRISPIRCSMLSGVR